MIYKLIISQIVKLLQYDSTNNKTSGVIPDIYSGIKNKISGTKKETSNIDGDTKAFLELISDPEKTLDNYKTYLDKSSKSTTAFQKVTSTAGKALKSFGAAAVNMAAGAAISFAVEKGIEGISAVVNYEKNMNEASSAMTDSVKQSSDSIDDYKDKISSLRSTMEDSSSSIEDVTNARKELISIQDEIISKYGAETDGIDLLNGSLESQEKLLDSISKKEFEKTRSEYNEKDFGDHFADVVTGNVGVSKFDQMLKKYENYDLSLNATKAPKEILDLADQLGFSSTIDDTGEKILDFKGNVEDVADAVSQFKSKIEELKETDPDNADRYEAWANSVENSFQKVDDFVASNKDTYDYNTYYEKILNSSKLTDFYKNLTNAQQEYQDALTSGDDSAIKQAVNNYKQYYNQINDITKDTSVRKYLSNLYESANNAMNQLNFDDAIEKNSTAVLKSVSRIKGAYSDLTEEQLASTDEVKALSKQYGVSSDYIVSKLKDVGAIQSDQYKELYSKFGDKLKTLSKDDLEIAYQIKNVGSMTFDQLVDKIRETKAIAANEIDINSRTNLENYNTAKEGKSQSADYDSYVSMMKEAQELYKAGKVGTEQFKKAAIAFSENGMDDTEDWAENMSYLAQYFTDDATGAQKFIDTLTSLKYKSGEAFATLDEDTGEYTLNLQDMEYMAEQLHMPLEMLSVLLQNLQSYNFTDSYFGTMDEGMDKLSSKTLELAEAKAKLATMDPDQGTEYEAQQKKVKDLTEDIETLKKGIDQLRNSEEKQPKDTGAVAGAQSLVDQYNSTEDEDERSAIQQAMNQYASDYNVNFHFKADGTVEVSRSIEEIKSDIDETQATLERLKQNNGGELDLDDSEVQDALDKMTELVKEKQDAEAPAIMSVSTEGLNSGVSDAVTKLQNVQNIINQIEQARITPGADTTQLESELNSAIHEVNNTPADIKAALNLNTDDFQSQLDTINAKVTAHATLDETDLTSLSATVAGVTPEMVVKANTNTANQQVDDVIAKIDSSTGTITVGADLTSAKNAVAGWDPGDKTIIVHEKHVKDVKVDGTAHAEGTAFANGSTLYSHYRQNRFSALVGGNWGLPSNQTSLVGEVSPEMLVRDGKWQLIGQNGAEFVGLKKGDIIFNGKQTQQLLSNGYVTGRGKAIGFNSHVMGTVSDNAFYGGSSGRIGGYSGFTGTSTSKSTSKSSSSGASATKAVSKNTSAVSSNTKSVDDLKDKFDSYTDWIEKFISAFEDQKSQFERLANDIYDKYQKQNSVISQEITLIKNFQSKYSKMYDAYMNQAYKSGLSKSYQNKVINGTINIESITNESLKEKIEEFQKWYEKATSVREKVQELNKDLKELYTQRLTNVQDDFDKVASYYDTLSSMYQSYIDRQKDTGKELTENKFTEMMTYANSNIKVMEIEYKRLQAELDSLVKNGSIKKYSDDWYEWQTNINSVRDSLYKAQSSYKDMIDSLREYHWDGFTKNIEKIDYSITELDDLMDRLNSDNFVDKDGNITSEGDANIALIGTAINKQKQKIADYTVALKKLDSELKNGVITQDQYTEYMRDYLDKIRDASKAVDDYKDKLVDLYLEGIKAENDALQDNISLRKEAFNKKKDYYEYDKTIRSKNKDINALKAQIAAMEGVASATGKAELARLKAQLSEKQEDLNDTKQDHYFDTVSSGYDDLADKADKVYNDTVDAVTRSTEMQEKVINEMLDRIKTNYKDAFSEINKTITDAGLSLSKDTDSSIKNVNSSKGANSISNNAQGSNGNAKASKTATSVKTNISGVTDKNAVTSVKLNKTSISLKVGASYTLTATRSPANSTYSSFTWKSSNSSIATVSNGKVTAKKAGSAKITVSCGGKTATCTVKVTSKSSNSSKSNSSSNSSSTKKYRTATNTTNHNLRKGAGYDYSVVTSMSKGSKVTILNDKPKSADGLKWYNVSYKGKDGKTYKGWTSDYYLKFAKGTKRVGKNVLANVGEEGEEIIMSPKHGLLTTLEPNDRVLSNEKTKNLYEMAEMGVGTLISNLKKGLIINPDIAGITKNSSQTNSYNGDCVVNIYPQTAMTKAELQKIADYSFDVWGKKMKDGLKATGRKVR